MATMTSKSAGGWKRHPVWYWQTCGVGDEGGAGLIFDRKAGVGTEKSEDHIVLSSWKHSRSGWAEL